jgi:hypothetical protein
MSDFELLRDLRALRGDEQPERDLWPAIAMRLPDPAAAAAPPARTPSAPVRWAMAAAVLLAAGVFTLATRAPSPSSTGAPLAEHPARADRDSPRLVFEQARQLRSEYSSVRGELDRDGDALSPTADPARYAADRQLAQASGELMKALAQQPNSPYLLRLLRRTEDARLRLSRPTA